jgi:hypothetical protein
MRRILEFERAATYNAANGYCDPERLIVHAETRAHHLSGEYVNDPMDILPGRDRLRDVREELADGRNHLVWWLQERQQNDPDDDRIDLALEALGYIALAYDRLSEEP